MKTVTIVGSGPAGLTAAIYCSRGGLKNTVIEGQSPGGQLTQTTDVENFPGFPDPISGPNLMAAMRTQAERFGTDFIEGDVTDVDFSGERKKVTVGETVIESDAVIIATGATANWLNLPSEQAYVGRGVSACATCDAMFFRQKKVVVIGGGDSALTEALHLTHFASQVTVVHRRQEFRASPYLVDLIKAAENVNFELDAVLEEVLGGDSGLVAAIRLRNVVTGEIYDYPCEGVFIAIGHTPATTVFKDHVDMDEGGYIRLHEGTATSASGVFAAGDVTDPIYKQAVTSAGAGCMAALDAGRFLR